MKPERIQLNAPTQKPTPAWGVYQKLEFVSPRKATSFANFVTEMADNHGRELSCTINVNRVTLFVPADASGELVSATNLVGEVVFIYERWKAPAEES